MPFTQVMGSCQKTTSSHLRSKQPALSLLGHALNTWRCLVTRLRLSKPQLRPVCQQCRELITRSNQLKRRWLSVLNTAIRCLLSRLPVVVAVVCVLLSTMMNYVKPLNVPLLKHNKALVRLKFILKSIYKTLSTLKFKFWRMNKAKWCTCLSVTHQFNDVTKRLSSLHRRFLYPLICVVVSKMPRSSWCKVSIIKVLEPLSFWLMGTISTSSKLIHVCK